jgi:UDP-N-acetylglucosamine 2-epimerase
MPEEINRVLTDHVSSLLFCPTDTAVKNLENEGVTRGVFNVGDVMYDAFLFYKELSVKNSNILLELELKPGGYCLATVHREENTKDPGILSNLFDAFEELASIACPFIIPLHPRTRKAIEKQKTNRNVSSHVRLITPVSYLDMIALETHARVILTDSGGVQKEAYFAEVPCVTLREETEWLETLDAGWNHLGGINTRGIIDAFQRCIVSRPKMQNRLFGKGNASSLIVRKLCWGC